MNEQQKTYANQMLWVLLSSAKTIEFAVTELNSQLPDNYPHKGDFIRLLRGVDAFMNVFKKRITQAENDLFKDIVLENVAIICEAVMIMSQIPPSQIDFVSEGLIKLAQDAVKREMDEMLGD